MNRIKVGESKMINVVGVAEHSNYISGNDEKMDARAVEAVKTAVSKARFCQKPIAGYDTQTKKAYLEYANGEKKYVD